MSYIHVHGLHGVLAALEAGDGRVRRIWLEQGRDDRRTRPLLEQAEAQGIPVERVRRVVLDRMAEGARHQGVVAEYRALAPLGEKDLPALLEGVEGAPLLLVLDGVQDPHNLGACLRSAAAAGVSAVIVPRDKAASLTPAVVKVASGGAEAVPLVQVTNLARTLDRLKDAGVWLTGATGEAEQSLYQLDLTGPLALVMGAEGKGLRRLTRERCDHLARIPIRPAVESLNVSVATGIFLFEALRQRGGDQV